MSSRPQTHYKRGQVRRDALLRAAVDLISERGIEGLSHRSVSARAGMPPSTTTYFFSSIDELIGEAVSDIADAVVGSFDALVDKVVQGGMAQDEFADRLVELLAAAQPSQVVVQFEAYLGTTRRVELVEPVRRIMRTFEKAAAEALKAAGVSEAEHAAKQFVAVIDGFQLHRLAWPRPERDRADLEEVLRRLLDSYLAGS